MNEYANSLALSSAKHGLNLLRYEVYRRPSHKGLREVYRRPSHKGLRYVSYI